MSASEKFGGSVANAMVKNGVEQDFAFDPAMILTIIGLVKTFIDMFQECRKDAKGVVKSAHRPGLLEQFKLRLYINAAIPDWKRAKQVQAGFLERCRTLTVEEAEELLREAD